MVQKQFMFKRNADIITISEVMYKRMATKLKKIVA